MKYFKGIYRSPANQYEIIAESYDKGLEFRVCGVFFYNPKTQSYDNNPAELLLQAKEQHKEELGDIKQIGKYEYLAQTALAIILHTLLHPKNTYKTNHQVQRN